MLAPLLRLADAKLSPEPRPVWTSRLSVGGSPLFLKIWTKRDAATEIEVLGHSKVLASGQDDLYFDGSIRPRLWPKGKETVLAFAANPGAGSGEYACLWRIENRGRRIERIGAFLDADLRKWPSHGIVREIRPTKYATHDILRTFPRAFDEERYRNARFIVAYRYDRVSKRLRLLGVRLASA